MDKECTKDHVLKIALWDFDWKLVGRRLLDSEQNVTDINKDESDEQNRRQKMLLSWKSQKGSMATYKVLMETFQELKYVKLAEKLMDLVEECSTGGRSDARERAVNETYDETRTIQVSKKPGQSRYHCRCSKKCKFVELIRYGCPEHKDTDSFPFLEIEKLTEREIKLLQDTLETQGEKMWIEFDNIRSQFEIIMKKNVNFESFQAVMERISGIKSFKQNICALHGRTNDIKSAKNHKELVDIIGDYITWFNCSLLQRIVKQCKQSGKLKEQPYDTFCKLFKRYEKARMSYCRRGIFECPSSLFSNKTRPLISPIEQHEKVMCLLVNDDKIKNIEHLYDFEAKLCDIFEASQGNFKLCSIGKGCIELVYLLPSYVHKALFPLNKKQLQGLATIGVTAICIETSYESITTLLENENSTLYLVESNNNSDYHDFKQKLAACKEDFEILKSYCCNALKTAPVEEMTKCVAEVPQKPHYQQYIFKCSGNLRQCSSVDEFFATLCSSYSNYLFYQLFEKVVVTYENEVLVKEIEKYKDKITSITTKAKVEELNDTRSCIINTTADCEVEIAVQIPFSDCTISDIEDVRDEIRRISYMFEFCHTLCGISGDSDTTTTKWVIPKVYSQHLQVDLLLSTIPLGKNFSTKKDAPRQLLTAFGVLKICIGGLCVFEYDPNHKMVSHLRRSILKQNITTNRESQLDHLTKPDDLSFRESNITHILQQFSIDQWLEFALRLGLSPQDIADCWSAQSNHCNFPNILLKRWLSTDDNASWYTLMTIVKLMLPPACDYADTIVQQYSQITEVNEEELKDLQETIPSIVRLPANVVEHVEMEQMDIDGAVENVAKAVDERLKAIEEVMHASRDELKEKSKSEEYWKRQEQLDKDLENALSEQDAKIEIFLTRTDKLFSELKERNVELKKLLDQVEEEKKVVNYLNKRVQSKETKFEKLKEQLTRLRRLKSQNAERLAALTSIPSKVYQLQQDAEENCQLCQNLKMNVFLEGQRQAGLLIKTIALLEKNEKCLDDAIKRMDKMLGKWADYFVGATIITAAGLSTLVAAAVAGVAASILTAGAATPIAIGATMAATGVGVGVGVGAASVYGWTKYKENSRKKVQKWSEQKKDTQAKRQRLNEWNVQYQHTFPSGI